MPEKKKFRFIWLIIISMFKWFWYSCWSRGDNPAFLPYTYLGARHRQQGGWSDRTCPPCRTPQTLTGQLLHTNTDIRHYSTSGNDISICNFIASGLTELYMNNLLWNALIKVCFTKNLNLKGWKTIIITCTCIEIYF